jgi:D-glycero-alpha-D-manno-heptose 1-phosphate guanylyltransferase
LHDLMMHFELHQWYGDGSLVSVALTEMNDFDRYGTVELYKNERIKSFHEKRPMKNGLINAGVYVIDRDLWNQVDVPEKFSFEKDVLERYVRKLRFMGFKHDGYFIDIGVPEDYEKANRDLVMLKFPDPAALDDKPNSDDEIDLDNEELPF